LYRPRHRAYQDELEPNANQEVELDHEDKIDVKESVDSKKISAKGLTQKDYWQYYTSSRFFVPSGVDHGTSFSTTPTVINTFADCIDHRLQTLWTREKPRAMAQDFIYRYDPCAQS
jgi:hypothetical protein